MRPRNFTHAAPVLVLCYMAGLLGQTKDFPATIGKIDVTNEMAQAVYDLTQRMRQAMPHTRVKPAAVRRMLLAIALQHCAVLTNQELIDEIREHLGRFG